MYMSLVFVAKKIGIWEQGTMFCSRLYNEYVWKTSGKDVFPCCLGAVRWAFWNKYWAAV